MTQSSDRQRQLAAALKRMMVTEGVKGAELRCWSEEDFPAIQRLSALEGWTTPQTDWMENYGVNSMKVSRYDIMDE